MKKNKNYFWNIHSSEFMRNLFYEKLIEYKSYIELEFVYKLFLNKDKIECFTRECYESLEHRTQFLEYLKELLKNGEIKMMIIERESRYPQEQEVKRGGVEKDKKYSFPLHYHKYGQDNYNDGLEKLIKMWNVMDTEDKRMTFESLDVLFSLPANEWDYAYIV